MDNLLLGCYKNSKFGMESQEDIWDRSQTIIFQIVNINARPPEPEADHQKVSDYLLYYDFFLEYLKRKIIISSMMTAVEDPLMILKDKGSPDISLLIHSEKSQTTEKIASNAINDNMLLIFLSLLSWNFLFARSMPSFSKVNSSLMASDCRILLNMTEGRKLYDMWDGL